MATIYTESFETIPSWFAGKGTIVAGHTGNAVALRGLDQEVGYAISNTSGGYGTYWNRDMSLDFWFNMSLTGTGTQRNLCQLFSGGYPVVSVGYTTLGILEAFVFDFTGLVISGGQPTLSPNVWHHLSVRTVVSATQGEIHVKLDGTEFATYAPANQGQTINTKPSSSYTVDSFYLWGNSTGTATTAYDDLTLSGMGVALAGVTKAESFPQIRTLKLLPTRTYHPLVSTQRTAKVKLITPPSIKIVKVAGGSRVWAPVAIFGHLTQRPTYGQMWPRGTMAGPPH